MASCLDKDLSSLIFRAWAGTQEITQQVWPCVSSDKGYVCQDTWGEQEKREQKENSCTENRVHDLEKKNNEKGDWQTLCGSESKQYLEVVIM